MRILNRIVIDAESIGTGILIDCVLGVAHGALGVLIGMIGVVVVILAVGNYWGRVNVMLKLAIMPPL